MVDKRNKVVYKEDPGMSDGSFKYGKSYYSHGQVVEFMNTRMTHEERVKFFGDDEPDYGHDEAIKESE